jgi:hypothetical protein
LPATTTVSLLRGAVCTGCAATHPNWLWHTVVGAVIFLHYLLVCVVEIWTPGWVRVPFKVSNTHADLRRGYLCHPHPTPQCRGWIMSLLPGYHLAYDPDYLPLSLSYLLVCSPSSCMSWLSLCRPVLFRPSHTRALWGGVWRPAWFHTGWDTHRLSHDTVCLPCSRLCGY